MLTRATLGVVLVAGCAPSTAPTARRASRPCKPACAATETCGALDDRLVEARRPLLDCIRRAATGGALDRAHRCYRALRLLESARWWLRTLHAEDPALPSIYREPVRSVRLEFLCRIEHLAGARTPEQVQKRYLSIVRSYP